MKGFICRWALLFVIAPQLVGTGVAQDGASTASNPISVTVSDVEPDAEPDPLDGLLDLSLEELSQTRVVAPAMQQVVTTVARQESTVAKTAAAVFVITPEMIRRSGARNVPELLRLVPGIQVAQIDSNKWAISIRGLNQRFANKLLVQIDGRTVYTPLFGGVYWDAQAIMLEDVERIEVVRGPGATVWGANAVNGVINILTKNSADTTGALVSVGGGKEYRSFGSGRVGGHVNENLHWRAYGKYNDNDNSFSGATSEIPGFPRPPGDVSDDWRQGRGGFRMDWTPSDSDAVTFQGDFYNGTSGSKSLFPTPGPAPFTRVSIFDDRLNGQNALLRWRHEVDDESDFQLQSFFDRTKRVASILDEDRNIFDIDFQHRMPIAAHHRLIWGAGYQTSRDRLIQDGYVLSTTPAGRSINVMGFFVQDEIELMEDELYFTVGSKFENNTFTQFEYQPSGRLVWTPNEREAYWGAVSRAIRRPARIDNDIRLRTLSPLSSPFGVHPLVVGNDGVVAEDLLAFEIGYRAQPTDRFSWDITAFHNDYNDLSSILTTVPFPPQLTFGNEQDARSFGAELTANYQINDRWRVYGSYSYLNLNIVTPDGSIPRNERADARHRTNLWFAGELREDVQLDVMFRYVDAINVTGVGIPSYLEMDVRLGWLATDSLELAVVGRNLLDNHHPEFLGEVFTGDIGTEVERSVYGVATWVY